MTTEEVPVFRCRATLDGDRCDYRGTVDELGEHANDAGHARCVICGRALLEIERQTCTERGVVNRHGDVERRTPCAERVRDDLTALAVAFAHLERVILQAAHRGLAWDALALVADGSLESPQRPNQYTRPVTAVATVHVEHDAIVGENLTHSAFVEERVSSDGREHVADHWDTDPMSVLAVLEHNERDWRHEFGHAPAVDMATVAGCLTYLRKWHWLAARTHPGFDDYATTVRELRARLEYVVGLIETPARGIPCACGTTLRRPYGTDAWTCRNCGLVVTETEYRWKLRVATHLPGWVSVSEAAAHVDRPMRTVQAWARLAEVPTACNRLTRRVMVELAGVQELAAETETRATRRAS